MEPLTTLTLDCAPWTNSITWRSKLVGALAALVKCLRSISSHGSIHCTKHCICHAICCFVRGKVAPSPHVHSHQSHLSSLLFLFPPSCPPRNAAVAWKVTRQLPCICARHACHTLFPVAQHQAPQRWTCSIQSMPITPTSTENRFICRRPRGACSRGFARRPWSSKLGARSVTWSVAWSIR